MPPKSLAGCSVREIAVQWNESFAVPELGLWSMLSTLPVVNGDFFNFEGQATPSSSNCAQMLFPRSAEICITRSYEITFLICITYPLKLSSWFLSGLTVPDRQIMETLCSDHCRSRWRFTVLKINSWESATPVLEPITVSCSFFFMTLGPSYIMFTSARSKSGTAEGGQLVSNEPLKHYFFRK